MDTSSLEFFESDGKTTNPTFSSVTKNFGFGIWDVGVSTVEGIIDIAKHPVETVKGLGYAVTHPIETGKGIWGAVTTSFTNFKEGNANVKARILGNVTGEIGLAVLTSKGIDKAAKTLKSSKFLKGTAKGWFRKRGSKLDWSIVSKKGETRFQHVMKHGSNNLQKQNHGIFYGDPIKNTNNAWLNKGKIKPITQGGSDLYVIPYKNAGYTAGYAGQGTNLNYITIVTKSGTNQIITAFPSGSGIPLKF